MSTRISGRMTASEGVLSLLGSIGSGEEDERQKWYLSGDLDQMSIQEEFLKIEGFDIGRSDVYPVLFDEENYKKALALILEHSISGWWNYKEKYVEYEICTAEEFDEKLGVKRDPTPNAL